MILNNDIEEYAGNKILHYEQITLQLVIINEKYKRRGEKKKKTEGNFLAHYS